MLTRLQAMNILAAAILMYDEVFAHESVVELIRSYPVTCQKNRRFGYSRYCVEGYFLDITREMHRFLCQQFVNDLYSSPSMHGTLLDQRVFESLVQRYLPIIHDHFQLVDVQLSVASLPWFLSL
jgi:hypothetical protein